MKLTIVMIIQLLVASALITPVVVDASPGSVKHASKKGTKAGAKRGASKTGTTQGARTGAAAGSTAGARAGATARPATRPATSPSNRQSAKAGYRAGTRSGYSRGYHHGRYHGGRYHAWDSARRDYYRWRTVTGLITLGVIYSSRPKQSTTVVVTGTTYYYYNGVYYASSTGSYVVVAPPPGAVVYAVPAHTTVVYVGSTPYYYVNGAYYVATDAPAQQPPPAQPAQQSAGTLEPRAPASKDPAVAEAEAALDEVPMTDEDYNYEVVAPPAGATVPYLPDEADEQKIDGKTYFLYDGTYYKPFANDGETIYMVVEDPNTK